MLISGALVFCVMSFCMASLLLRPKNTQTLTEGKLKSETMKLNCTMFLFSVHILLAKFSFEWITGAAEFSIIDRCA